MSATQAVPNTVEMLESRSPNVLRDMIIIYVKASIFAVAAFIVLMVSDSHFTFQQVMAFMVAIALLVPIYVAADIVVIRRQVIPLNRFFKKEGKEDISREEAVDALICLLNLPWKTVVRILTVHGPGAGLVAGTTILLCEIFFDIAFSPIQSAFLLGFVLAFATPAHALFEYFAVSRYCERLLSLVWPHCGGYPPELNEHVVQLGLKPKLIVLIVFVSTLPILFLAASIITKLGESAGGFGNIDVDIYISVGSITFVCLVGGLAAALIMAREVGSHVTKMLGIMHEVEGGDFSKELTIVSADEYMDLYRGFNKMIEGLRSELEMLEVTKELSGEIHLDALLGRLMQSAANLLGAERATVFLFDAKTNELWSRYAMGLNQGEIRFPADTGIAGVVFKSGQPLQVDDAYADPRFNQDVDKATDFRTRNILCIPILTKTGARVGVTQVVNKASGAFNHRDLQRLAAFTAQVSVSLENAQLFDEVLQIKNYNENILASASDAIVTFETDGTILKINQAGMSLLTGGEDPVGRDIRELFAEGETQIISGVRRVIETGRSDITLDIEFTTRAGDTVSAHVKTDALQDGEGKIIGALLSFEDLSDEKRLKSSMSRYLSKDIVDQVMDGGLDALGGTDQEISVLFSDIRSFSSISEELSATDIVDMLNDYFTRMVDDIFANSGVLDKFIGDAIMAIFGTPFPALGDADNAVRTALGMFQSLDQMNTERAACGHLPIRMGIGVNSGRAVVGNIGSPKRMEYTVIGDTVNLASRVESLTKHYGAEILVTDGTRRLLSIDVPIRELDLIAVKGKDQPDVIHEIIRPGGASAMLTHPEALTRFAEAVACYRGRDWLGAIERFQALAELAPGDRPSEIYLERARTFLAEPPPENWDGVWRFDNK